MKDKKMIGRYLIIDLVFFIICCFGLYFISQKTSLPFNYIYNNDEIRIFDGKNSDIPDGSLLVSINNNLISSYESIEFILDRYQIDDIIELGYLYNEEFYTTESELTSYYGTVYILIAALTGLIFFLLAIFVLHKTAYSRTGVLFHWLSLSVAGIIMMSWGRYDSTFLEIGYLTRALFHTCYLAAPAMFLHFAFVFPTNRLTKNVSLIKSIYIFAVFLVLIINIFFIAAVFNQSPSTIDAYLKSFGILRVFIVICVLLSVLVFITSYFLARVKAEKNKLKWILVGFFCGPVIYILFWVIPQLLNMKEPLPEELIVILSNSVPVTFAIAIVKYHLFDIDYIINRSIVYILLIIVLIGIYISTVVILVELLNIAYSPLISAATAIFVAFLFLPVKNNIQNLVDKKFFRIKYNFRIEVKRIISSLNNFNDIPSLSSFLINEINSLIPVEQLALYKIIIKDSSVSLIYGNNIDPSLINWIVTNKSLFEKSGNNVIADNNKIDKEVKAFTGHSHLLHEVNLALILPIVTDDKKFSSLLLIGNKLSRLKFSLEDIDFLKSIIATAESSIARITLQEQLIQERFAAERLEELVKRKSLYVSSVSHDLKIPLTSIKIFTELILKDKTYLSDKIKDHLNIIEGETDRLASLVSDILDLSRIEKGIKRYDKKLLSLNKIVTDLISVLKVQIENKGFLFRYELSDFEDLIFADEYALKQAMENLISNSLKYSRQNRNLFIRTYSSNNFVVIEVEDSGIGISESDQRKIFDPYFRVENDSSGVGLGLYIVKYIMDSHDGVIEVNSIPVQGTTVALKFPKIINQKREA